MSRGLLAGLMLLIFVAGAPVNTASPLTILQPAAEIVGLEVDGTDLRLTLLFDDAVDPTASFEVLYVAPDGTTLESPVVLPVPGGGELDIFITGHFAGLTARGWQHRIDIIDSGGAAIDSLDIRFGFDCDASVPTVCEVRLHLGLRSAGAVAVSADLAPLLPSGQGVDLAQVIVNEPTLLGRSIETSVDLVTEVPGITSGCACFYTYDVVGEAGSRAAAFAFQSVGSGQSKGGQQVSVGKSYEENIVHSSAKRFVADSTSPAQLDIDFRCFEVVNLTSLNVTINGGVLVTSPLAELAPCAQTCTAEIEWSLPWIVYDAEIETAGDSTADAAYEMAWQIDGLELFAGGLALTSAGDAVLEQVGQGALPASIVTRPMPSSSQLEPRTVVELRDWSPIELPQSAIALNTAHQATGLATCAPPTTILHLLLVLDDIVKATLPVVIGPP